MSRVWFWSGLALQTSSFPVVAANCLPDQIPPQTLESAVVLPEQRVHVELCLSSMNIPARSCSPLVWGLLSPRMSFSKRL